MGSNVCGGYVVVNISHHAVVSDESRNRFTISKLRFELADFFSIHVIQNCGLALTKSPLISKKSVQEKSNLHVADRYDFASPTSCPYCTRVFDEAYGLSRHIKVSACFF